MIPSFFVKLDKLPVNANGKLDRSSLPEVEAGKFKNEYAAPETDLQKALCSAFEKVLGVERVGIDDDFFALGGDSIKSAMTARECELYFVSIADIFKGKTPRGIEKILLKKAAMKTNSDKKEKPLFYPLTPSERGMYIEQKLNENSVVYNLNLAVNFQGTDFETVKSALKQVFSVHESFHSIYGEENGIPVRILTNELPAVEEKSAVSFEDVKQNNLTRPTVKGKHRDRIMKDYASKKTGAFTAKWMTVLGVDKGLEKLKKKLSR